MTTRHVRGNITWVDLESPTHDELDVVMREFSIDSAIEDEIISPTPYPIEINFPEYLYLILHFPTSDPESGTRNQEIDFIVGKDFLITARYEVIDSIYNLHKVFEAEEMLGLPKAPTHADVLLERIMRRMYNAIGQEIESAAHTLERIERDIFNGKERLTVRAISDVGRTLLRFDTTLARQAEPLNAFLSELATPAFFGKRFLEHQVQIEAERDHVAGMVTSYRAVVNELRKTNDSLLSSSQNEIIKRLTVIAAVTSPATLIATLFGMNVEHSPFVGYPHDFWIIAGISFIIALCFFLFMRFRKWV